MKKIKIIFIELAVDINIWDGDKEIQFCKILQALGKLILKLNHSISPSTVQYII